MALIPITVILGIAVFGFVGGGASSLRLNAKAAQPISPAVDQVFYDSADLNKAAQKADEISNKVYEGMGKLEQVGTEFEDRTQPSSNKGRTQHLDDARSIASEKWRSYADKIRSAEESNEPLNPVERVNLDHLIDDEN